MKRTLQWIALMGLLVGASGCAAEAGDAHHQDEPTATIDQALAFASPSGNCYSSGGQYWCQDYYTAKWCTTAHSANGWDWKNCTWNGWNSNGTLYCSNGWQWGASHLHCD